MSVPRSRLTTGTRPMPTFDAAPMSPAIHDRDGSGHTSLTSATPSDHSPPMPSDAMNLSTAMCQASVASPQAPVNSE